MNVQVAIIDQRFGRPRFMIELAWVAYVAFSHNLRQVEPHETALEERSEDSNAAQH